MKQKVNLLITATVIAAVLLVTLASCGLLTNGDETKISINLPCLSQSARALTDDANSRLKSEHRSFRVHMNDKVLEGTGGHFSASFPIGLKVDVYVESLNSKGEVIVRTVTKSIVVSRGENRLSFDMKNDGDEVPVTPPAPVTYTVTYSWGSGITGVKGDLPAQSNVEYGNTFEVQMPASVTRSNYNFLGWDTEQNKTSNPTYFNGGSNLTVTVTENITLYAVWERVYTLTLNLNGGSWASDSDNKTQYSSNDLPLTLQAPTPPDTLTGYVFAGWIDGGNNYGWLSNSQIPSGTTGNKTYYAVYHTTSAGTAASTTSSATGSIEFVAVQGGTVPLAADYMPVVSNFSMSKTEITQSQWKAVMGDSNLPSGMSPTDGIADNNPVNSVSWYDAIAFCNKLSLKENKTPYYSVNGIDDWENLQYQNIPTSDNADWNATTCNWSANGYRLPTEAEWVYAARGGINHSDFSYSGSNTLDDVAWYKDNSESKTHEVGQRIANALGISDMSGNVFEFGWEPWSNDYDKDAMSDPTGLASGPNRIIYGGGFSGDTSTCDVTYRSNPATPYMRGANNVGFRIVCRP